MGESLEGWSKDPTKESILKSVGNQPWPGYG